MKKTRTLLLAATMFSAAMAVDLTKPVPEVRLLGGKTLKNVQFLAFSESAATARWENGRGSIAYKDLPQDIIAAIEARKPRPPAPAKAVEPPAPPPRAPEPPPPAGKVSLGVIDLRATDNSGSYVYYSWKADVRNTTARPYQGAARIKLFDDRGFEIESETSETIYARPGESVTVTATGIIKSALWQAVKRYEVQLVD